MGETRDPRSNLWPGVFSRDPLDSRGRAEAEKIEMPKRRLAQRAAQLNVENASSREDSSSGKAKSPKCNKDVLRTSLNPVKRPRTRRERANYESLLNDLIFDLRRLAMNMREGVAMDVATTYLHWRFVEQSINHCTCDLLPGELPRLELPANYYSDFGNLLQHSHEMAREIAGDPSDYAHYDILLAACVLYNDDFQEANLGIFEPLDCCTLDRQHSVSLHVGHKFRFWRDGNHQPHVVDASQNGRDIEYPYKWAVLYFRQHLVLARYVESEELIQIYNTAGASFLIGENPDVDNGGKMLSFYMSQWHFMSKMLWPKAHNFSIQHLAIQGANDCGIWTWIYPRLYSDAGFRQLIGDSVCGERLLRGRVREKQLREIFDREVAASLVEREIDIPFLTADSN